MKENKSISPVKEKHHLKRKGYVKAPNRFHTKGLCVKSKAEPLQFRENPLSRNKFQLSNKTMATDQCQSKNHDLLISSHNNLTGIHNTTGSTVQFSQSLNEYQDESGQNSQSVFKMTSKFSPRTTSRKSVREIITNSRS